MAETNVTLLDALRRQGYHGRVALTARISSDAARLRRAGPDLILCPHLDAADRAVEQLLPEHGSERAAEDRAGREIASDLSSSHG